MSFQEINGLTLAITGAVAWWLSGQEARQYAGTPAQERFRRLIRIGLSLGMMEGLIFSLRKYLVNSADWVHALFALLLALLIAFLWIGALSHLLAVGFNKILDSGGGPDFDPKHQVRHLDQVGELIRSGRRDAAIRLCKKFIAAGEGDRSALEMTLAHLQGPEESGGKIKLGGRDSASDGNSAPAPAPESLEDLLKQKYYGSAIEWLERKIKEQPADLEYRLKLAEVHAVYCHNHQRAEKLVEELARLPGVTPEQAAQAEERLRQWKVKN